MPVSHPLKCVFVHVPKCAGTSIESALGMHGDLTEIGVRPYLNQEAQADTLFGKGLQHMTAVQLREHLGDSLWPKYFSFAIVRNPWDRVVSHAAWTGLKWSRREAVTQEDVDALVDDLWAQHRAGGVRHAHLRPQLHWLSDAEGQIIVDHVGRYETLHKDLAFVADRLKVDIRLDRRMSSVRDPYRDYFAPDRKAKVAEIYAEDCARLGYTF